MDIPSLPTETLKRKMRDAVLSRAARVPGVIVGYVQDRIVVEVRELRSDIDAALDYIASLPEHARRTALYELYASGFSHYLPKKLVRHYVFGSGSPYILPEKEMIDCNPYISLLKCKVFADELDKLTAPVSKPMSFNCRAIALTNGTLGQFTVKMKGNLEYSDDDDWTLTGKMTFYDIYDFDPKDFNTGGRTVAGELKTRAGYYGLPGKAFTVESEELDFEQSSADPTVVWKGGTPTSVPDRLSELDIEVAKPDQ